MIDPVLEQSLPRPDRDQQLRMIRGEREPSRWWRWAWSQVSAFRVGLTVGYIGFLYYGVAALVAGVPAFRTTAPEPFALGWPVLVIVGAVVGIIGSIRDSKPFERIELAGAWLLFLTLFTYAAVLHFIAYTVGDVDRASIAALVFFAATIPGVRMLWLMSRLRVR